MKAKFLRELMFFTLVSFLSSNAFADGRKVALIWGNSSYMGDWQTLPVVQNDANTMKKVLESIGFETQFLYDGTLDMMKNSLREFSSKAKNADIAIFYYSGHATIINDGYYLVPAKTILPKDYLTSDLLPTQDILRALSKSRLQLLFFDSCRDRDNVNGDSKGNPNIRIPDYVDRSNSKLPTGTWISYAVNKGKKAYTGNSELSIFTKVLAEHLTDGDEFRTVWANIRNELYLAQNQIPTNEGFYESNLYLNPSGRKFTAPAQSEVNHNSNKKSIVINTNVPNAKIDFYGTTYGTGSSLLFEIGKDYTYTVTAPGFQTYVGELSVTSTTPSNINISLKKDEAAELRISCNTVASVYLDDKYVGQTPLKITTTSGIHSVSLSSKGYYKYYAQLDLTSGVNSKKISMTHKTPWFFDWDDSHGPTDFISYNFSPKYQIGLQYLHRFEDTHFLLGGSISFSTGLFRGLKLVEVKANSSTKTEVAATVTDENNNSVVYNYSTTTTTGFPEEYSEEIDPYQEAKKYNSNFMFLVTGGYMPCNGILLEAGFGAASHCDKVYMPCNYTISKTITTNMNTGEVVGEPSYEYTRNEGSYWYNGKVKWSPAMRLGAKFNIPVGIDNFLTVGGGFTHLFSNTKFSSWDVSIGFAWSM